MVRHWNARTGQQLAHQQLSDLETLWAFNGKGRLLAAARNDLAVWNAGSGRMLAALPQPSWVTAVASANDPAILATGTSTMMASSLPLGHQPPDLAA